MLEVTLLGGVTIRLDGQPINNFRSQTEIALLAYLSHSGQPHNREILADLLWDTESTGQSLSNLRTVLTRLRKQFIMVLVAARLLPQRFSASAAGSNIRSCWMRHQWEFRVARID
jgi:DNA-binding SARP family transcriptional activator